MGTIKEISEDASIVVKQVGVLQKWASASYARAIFVTVLLGICLFVAQYWYINDLLDKAQKNTKSRAFEAAELVRANGYQVALDAVELCLDAKREKVTLQAWYCEHAVVQYKKASTDWPQDRVNEVIARLAYGAMKNDLSHYMRSIQVDRVLRAPASKEEEALALLLTKTVVVLWVLVVLAVVLGAYLVLWILPNRQQATPAV